MTRKGKGFPLEYYPGKILTETDASTGNKQLREVETLQEQLKQDRIIILTEKEKNMAQLAEKYQQ